MRLRKLLLITMLIRLTAPAQTAQELCNNGHEYYTANNYTEAVKCFKKAIELGDTIAIAQYNLGICYYNGNGVTKNYTEAVKCFKKAAEQGYALAQHNLGACYYFGHGVPKSISNAAK